MALHPIISLTPTAISGHSNAAIDMERIEKDYSLLLVPYNFQFVESGYYWQVGFPDREHGWILHLSVIHCQLSFLLETLIPIFAKNPIPFKMIRNKATAKTMISGSLGYGQVGKMICIYPRNNHEAACWAITLIALTQGFRGPKIPTDCHLGAIVYTSYGPTNNALVNNVFNTFKLPKGASWPYSELTTPMIEKEQKILNHSYYILKTLKPDVKGGVYLALHFRRLWQLKTCLIKEGRSNMFSDDYGRDMRNRLQWQYKLYQDLHKTISLPKVFDYFESNGNSYLVMEYIKGTSMTRWLQLTYQSHTWVDLPNNLKIAAINLYIQILHVVKRMHEKGFIHRDLNDTNLIISPKGKIFPIDLELTWDAGRNHPAPPYTLGTPGFMSPDQERKVTPTVNDDIYALGGLLLLITTNLFPTLFNCTSPDKIVEQVSFFTQEKELSQLISDCRQLDPVKRPVLSQVIENVETFRNKLQDKPTHEQQQSFSLTPMHDKSLDEIIQAGLNGVNHRKMLSKINCWISPTHQIENIIGNEQTERKSYIGWHTGISGPLWLLAIAKQANYTTDDNYETFRHNWTFIDQNLPETCKSDSTLYHGSAGVAIALVEGMNSGLVSMKKETLRQLQDCFQNVTLGQSLCNGLAGQIIALLYCKEFLDKKFLDEKLIYYVNIIIDTQMANGAWNCHTESGITDDIFVGLDKGVAGIVWGLLEALQYHRTSKLEETIQKGLRWIISQADLKRGFYSWSVSTKNKKIDPWSISYGMPGILLVLIKAYEYFKLDQYRTITESVLSIMPARPVLWNLSLTSGIAGIGELYLEAFRIFKTPAWFENATWIAQTLKTLFRQETQGSGMWTTGISGYATADLFIGNCGILHFLMRYLYPIAFPHPLCAKTIKSYVHINPVSAAVGTGSGEVENL